MDSNEDEGASEGKPRSWWPRSRSDHPIDVTRQRFAAPLSAFVTLVAITFAAAFAWTKVPDKNDVRHIAQEASRQTAEKQESRYNERYDQAYKRLEKVEKSIDAQARSLVDMNRRMDSLIILMAGGVAEDLQRYPRARRAAAKVRTNLAAGRDPLEGTSLAPEAKE